MENKEVTLPLAPIRLAVLNSCTDLGNKVNERLIKMRSENSLDPSHPAYSMQSHDKDYRIECNCPRFGTGEAKGIVNESVRGKDLFIMCDVTNHYITYKINGRINHMSPDDHFQDLKRIIAAATGKAHRISVILPFLYESRQHKRSGRESLDCALALEELVEMGVQNIITFDAHDARVQNSIPIKGFDNITPVYQFTKVLLRTHPEIKVDPDHLMIISPDEGAMHRAVYFSSVLGVDMGMFYKRRDYTTIVDGKNPIVAHEFLGRDLEGKDVIVIDDMIASGGSMLDVAKQLKERNAGRIFVCCTFGLFTAGLEVFDKAYEEGLIEGIVSTNLIYNTEELRNKPYFMEADLSKYIAYIIDSINNRTSISAALDPTSKIHALLEKYQSNN